jgi:hypothetical protein
MRCIHRDEYIFRVFVILRVRPRLINKESIAINNVTGENSDDLHRWGSIPGKNVGQFGEKPEVQWVKSKDWSTFRIVFRV